MAKTLIPVYDICTIDQRAQKDLLIEEFGPYLQKHYGHLQRPHRHSFYHLVLFQSGKGRHSIDFEQFEVSPYQIYFMIPGQVHSWSFEEQVDGYIIHFGESLFASFLQPAQYLQRFSFFSGIAADGVCQLPPISRSAITNLFKEMHSEVQEAKEQYLDLIRLKLLELFILVARTYKSAKEQNAPSQKQTLLRSFQHLVDQHYRDIRLPKEYAQLLYITPNHLNALCQDLLGTSAGDIIRKRIVLEAKRLLTNAEMTIAEVAYDLNFSDNSYFNRFFKKSEGITPDEFRKTNLIQ